MLSRVQSFVLAGVDAMPCEVEVDLIESGLPKELVVGLPDAAVKESLDRVRSAIINAGFAYPQGRVLINLAPADVRKEGPVYDLPMAVGLLMTSGVIPAGRYATNGDANEDGIDPSTCLIAGELALDGRLRPIKGAISMAALARAKGIRAIIVPQANAAEAAVVEGVEVFGARTLAEVIGLLNGLIPAVPHPAVDVASLIQRTTASVDFSEIKGQEGVKRALTIAAAGGHNLLMIGPAGTGKTMMAKALPGVLPPMSTDEALEVTRIYSAAGLLASGGPGLVSSRPVRSPHHTASSAAIIGGGSSPKPGEVTLAHRGVLFLDEAPEFPRAVLDAMRQPLEDRVITIARSRMTLTFPASFMLVMAMNPTAKGPVATNDYGKREMDKYLSRLSGPAGGPGGYSCGSAGGAVEGAVGQGRGRHEQRGDTRERGAGAGCAARSGRGRRSMGALSGKQLDELAPISEPAKELLGQAITELAERAGVRQAAAGVADDRGFGRGGGGGAGACGGGGAVSVVGSGGVREYAVRYTSRLLGG